MKVAIVLGSKSDFEVCQGAVSVLKKFGVEFVVKVMSAHRTPELSHDFSKNAIKNGFSVIIAAAGKAAHLAGVLAANTTLPIIGLPIKSSTMDGLDSLLSTVQMPSGIPVATVAINGADNAALLAIQILALQNKDLAKKLEEFKKEMVQKVIKDDLTLQAEL